MLHRPRFAGGTGVQTLPGWTGAFLISDELGCVPCPVHSFCKVTSEP